MLYQQCAEYVRMLYDTFTLASPQLTVTHFLLAHRPFLRELNISRFSTDAEDIRNYHAQHEYAGQLLIVLCDMIIENDPDAIIVLQADHGIHKEEYAEQVAAIYGDDTPITDFFNSTFSCIRIPDKLKDEEKEKVLKNPLNISRYLVNCYVGDNYSYLQAD